MPNFFIARPVFAWVISILICLIGAISMLKMGIAAYPDIAPPQVTISATYPGANAATMESNVTQVIEQQLTGIDNLLYFSSTSNSNGTATITLSFATGTSQDIAQVQVQNRVALAQPLLPAEVTQQGVVVSKASPDILLFVSLGSDNPAIDAKRLGDIVASRIQPVLARITGIGNTFLLGSEYAMRIWLDPDKLQGYGLSATQVVNAINAQNAQFATGSLGADPAVPGQSFTATVSGDTLFSSTKQFENIILRANSDGTTVRLSDVAHVIFGGQAYGTSAVRNGKQAGGIGLFLLPGANALAAAKEVNAEMAVIGKDLPKGVSWSIPFDTTPFITASIHDVVKTLIEAVALVFVVMLIFLQNIRATIIPTLVIPVALLGTFFGLSLLHFSINQLTLFGMVLAIGIVVDDAIVVIENDQSTIMKARSTCSPQEATRKAMEADHGRDHRHHRRARRRVHSFGAAGRRDRRHLFPVCAHHRHLHGLLGVPGHVLHAVAVRLHLEAARSRGQEEHRVPLVRRGVRPRRPHLRRPRRSGRPARAAMDDGVRADRGARRIPVHPPADELRTRRGSGVHARPRQSALGSHPGADR